MFWKSLLKTIVSAVAGAVAPALLTAAQQPSGGMAHALASDPLYAEIYGLGVLFAHNVYDHVFGAPQGPTPQGAGATGLPGK